MSGEDFLELFSTTFDLKTDQADAWNCGNWSKRVEGEGSSVRSSSCMITLPNNAYAESVISNTALPLSNAMAFRAANRASCLEWGCPNSRRHRAGS